jgi:MscS family membrane protein
VFRYTADVTLNELMQHWPSTPWMQSLTILLIGFVLVAIARFFTRTALSRVTQVTPSDLDDRVVAHLHTPLSATIFLVAIWQALVVLKLPPPLPYLSRGFFLSLAVLFWAIAAGSVVTLILESLVANREKLSWVRPRTVPIFKMLGRGVIFGGAGYFFFLAWDLDVTGWLASAGIVGVAIGFASKDSLATLIAGMTILADAPYKLGDILLLENGDRGRVSEIGLRTTRIITRDQVEIIVPNTIMANTRLINESGGAGQLVRASTRVSVAYGVDIDEVRALLLRVATEVEHVTTEQEPQVYFTEFGDSGLIFDLRVWLNSPTYREVVIDALNRRIYKVFGENEIEIPYSKHDIYLHSAPGGPEV